jgi:hypothetical protein
MIESRGEVHASSAPKVAGTDDGKVVTSGADGAYRFWSLESGGVADEVAGDVVIGLPILVGAARGGDRDTRLPPMEHSTDSPTTRSADGVVTQKGVTFK